MAKVKAKVNTKLYESAFIAELRRRGATDAMVAKVLDVFKNEVLPDIAKALNDLPFQTLKANDIRLVNLRAMIAKSAGWERIAAEMKSGVAEAATTEALTSAKELSSALPFYFEPLIPSPDLLLKTVFSKPFNDKLMAGWFDELQKTAQDSIYESFRVGMIEGKSISEMAKDLLERNYDAFTTNGIKRAMDNAEATARTAANWASTQARISFGEANSDVIKGVIYIATLDDRTTITCMALHGKFYPIDDMGPVPPQHYNCRSTLGYVTKSWEEMGLEGKDVEFKQRFREEGASSMDGKVPVPETFDEWLKDQPESVQDALLGPVRAELWRNGDIDSISGFAAANGDELTLAELGYSKAGEKL